MGLIGALVAAVFVLLDLRRIPRGTPAFATARAHLTLNAVAAVLFAAGYAWRAGDHVELDKTRWGQLALSAVAVAFLIAAIWLGGKLTYHHGIRVTGQADHDGGVGFQNSVRAADPGFPAAAVDLHTACSYSLISPPRTRRRERPALGIGIRGWAAWRNRSRHRRGPRRVRR